MGLSPSDWLGMTVEELDKVLMQAQEARKIEEYAKGYQTAFLASVIANCHRDPKRRPRPFKPEDFMAEKDPRQKQRKPPQTVEEQLAIAKAINAALGGDVVD